MDTPVILSTKGLTRKFGDLTAVSDVSLEVREGEIFGIAGPNGAGKSTLFNLISGVLAPSSGEINFMGHCIGSLKPHQICRLGLARTFQIPSTFETMTVAGNIRIGAMFGNPKDDRRDWENRTAELIDLLELSDIRDSSAYNLDLYANKLVMFGAALATDCKLLLLDEPMAGLSMNEVGHFTKLLRKINGKKSITVMIIEHLIDTLVGISDRIMVLHLGTMIYLGAAEEMTKDQKVIEVYLGEKED